MSLIDAITSTPGLRQFISPPSFELGQDLRDAEPTFSMDWSDEPSAETAILDDEPAAAAADVFLVCRQNGATGGRPLFSRPFASMDHNLALSEDGYLINSAGQFLLGMLLDEEARSLSALPEIIVLDDADLETCATTQINYRVNLSSYPMTAMADFDTLDSELLNKTLFARDPSIHGSGIVLGDDRMKFLDRTLAGGSVRIVSPEGASLHAVFRWAKMTSLRSGGRDSWNLFYRVRRDARAGEVAWKNIGYQFVFGPDGRLETVAHAAPVIDMVIDGKRMGNLSIIFGADGITQFADRGGLVKVLKATANGRIGSSFTGISMSSQGRLYAHYTNGFTRPIADIHFSGDEPWFAHEDNDDWREISERRVA